MTRRATTGQSVKYYSEYLDEEPFSDSAWYNLGIIYNKTGEYGKSIEAYDYALAINPENTFALFNKANILSNLEKYSEAMDVYREFVEEEPDSLEGLTYLAECYDKTGDEVMARKYYTEAIDITPDFRIRGTDWASSHSQGTGQQRASRLLKRPLRSTQAILITGSRSEKHIS
ncbi:MAG: tetratricopeptide repeat protein [Marinilabiliales bacterium]|nr:tetratricopeptide repeat protein [Marinilabiliales bacterium]